MVLNGDFGVFPGPGSSKSTFESTRVVPYVLGLTYGWYISIQTLKPTIHWREEVTVPAEPATWGIPSPDEHRSFSADRLTTITEHESMLRGGVILDAWTLEAGDPKGQYRIRVFVEGHLAKTFEFEVSGP